MAAITEDYVSFETAKLLKDKGFNEFTFSDYNENGIAQFNEVETRVAKGYQRPTLQMAMKWLREVHNILILIDVRSGIEQESIYCWQLEDKHTGDYIGDIIGECSLYEEAVESAIKYCLENLI